MDVIIIILSLVSQLAGFFGEGKDVEQRGSQGFSDAKSELPQNIDHNGTGRLGGGFFER